MNPAVRALRIGSIALVAAVSLADGSEPAPASKPLTMTEVLAASSSADWREPDPRNTLYLELDAGRVVLELAPEFAPRHVENIRALVRTRYFDGLAILRSQDNYVVQWGDPEQSRPLGAAAPKLPLEVTRSAGDLGFTALPDRDTYAPEVGFARGLPVARDPRSGEAWLVHCYGMVGAGRDVAADSGNGAELYVVIGHSPRHLDRNVTLVGRVLHGMELLSTLPRGTAALGFYEKPEQRVPIRAMRVAADVPPAERTRLEVLRTDTKTFEALVQSRRNRRDEWFIAPAGAIEICNVPIPVRN
jgi:peptidylprolyl isomerase